jgi:MobA/VirD2-like, nuclease domain
MILFVSQRGNENDMAAHVMNEKDNEIVRVISVEGTVAEDVFGALAEIKMHRELLTNAKNGFVSTSINPDHRQDPLSLEQITELADRLDVAFGTVGQPRIVVEHVKNDRQHYHILTSRIDTINEKAIEIPFDRLKSMMVVREFARDHGIALPDGYYKDFDRSQEKDKSFTLQEKFQQEKTGISKEQRMEIISDLWERRDTPESFINSLQHHGYILCNGRRPYVLVDMFGKTNSLPKLISDSAVRTKQIREFLGEDRKLPEVEEAAVAAKELLDTLKDYELKESRADRMELLKRTQADRRKELGDKIRTTQKKNQSELGVLEDVQLSKRKQQRCDYLNEKNKIRNKREEVKPTGLPAFLGRVSGVDLVRKKVHQYQDKKRHDAYVEGRKALLTEQSHQRLSLKRIQEVKGYELQREKRSLQAKEQHELRSLTKAFELEQANRIRSGSEHMPGIQLTLTPRGRPTMVLRAKQRHTTQHAKEFRQKQTAEKYQKKEIQLYGNFSEVAGTKPSKEKTGAKLEFDKHLRKDKGRDSGREQ